MSTNRRDYLDELNDPIRRAAEQVRANEPPSHAERRAVARARRALRSKATQRPRFRRDLLAVAGMAAAILLCIMLWNSFQNDANPETRTEVATLAPEKMDKKNPIVIEKPAVERGIGDGRDVEPDISLTRSDQNKNELENLTKLIDRAPEFKPGPDATGGPGGFTKGDKTKSLNTGLDKESKEKTGTTITPPRLPIDVPPPSTPVVTDPVKSPDPTPVTGRPTPPADSNDDTIRARAELAKKIEDEKKQNGKSRIPFANQPKSNEKTPEVVVRNDDKKPGTPDPSKPADPKQGEGRRVELLLKDLDREGDAKELGKLQQQWGLLPEKERAAQLDQLTRTLPPAKREEVLNLFANMPVDNHGRKPEKGPTVWHRDRQQPTMARVYVGDGNALELVSLNVTTTIEGPRARTVVDHIFRNPHARQLEGTFEYPLPTGASPSYFAMFLGQTRETVPARFGRRDVALPAADALARLTPAQLVKHVDTADWGDLREARVVNNEKALETYEEVVRGRIDPALLEYAGGNTFRGRVFPIAPKGYNRVIIAYEETLTWDSGAWNAYLGYNWQSAYLDADGIREVAPYETWDTALTWSGIKNLKVKLGVRNLTDRNPPFTVVNQYFQVGFDPTYVDPRGRTYRAALEYKFK